MRTREFKALKIGDRVRVTGSEDEKSFLSEVGTVISEDGSSVLVGFDAWRGGHGRENNEWFFHAEDVRDFDITVLPVVKLAPAPVAKKRPHGKQEYKGNGKHEWETVTGNTVRLRVPGGWLYSARRADYSVDPAVTFVPVPTAVGYAV